LHAALVFEQLEDAAEVFLARDDRSVDDGLFNLLDVSGVGELRGLSTSMTSLRVVVMR